MAKFMKKIKIKIDVKKNTNIDINKVNDVREVLKELREIGVHRVKSYDILPPFSNPFITNEENDMIHFK